MARSSRMPYVRQYDNRMLDDIHNYFPAILYDPESFRTVGDLLGYVQRQTRQHYDLFSSARAAYHSGSSTTIRNSTVNRHTGHTHAHPHIYHNTYPNTHMHTHAALHGNHVAQRSTSPRLVSTPPPPPRRRVDLTNITRQLVTDLIGVSASQPTLFEMFGQLGSPTQGFMDPVVVRPTEEEIQRATVIEVVEEEGICAICQSEMSVGSEARSLSECEHTFHPGCIDTWFQRSVHCPVCRHDIRVTGEGGQSAAAP
jgi:hypothetical protein